MAQIPSEQKTSVHQEKVDSLVKQLETMMKGKSDLKMAVYKEYENLGEQFNEILGENSCDATASNILVPVKAQLVNNALEYPLDPGHASSDEEDLQVERVASQILASKQLCSNCDVLDHCARVAKDLLCQECNKYQQTHNKPRPLAVRSTSCRKCEGTVWLEGNQPPDEEIVCEGCRLIGQITVTITVTETTPPTTNLSIAPSPEPKSKPSNTRTTVTADYNEETLKPPAPNSEPKPKRSTGLPLQDIINIPIVLAHHNYENHEYDSTEQESLERVTDECSGNRSDEGNLYMLTTPRRQKSDGGSVEYSGEQAFDLDEVIPFSGKRSLVTCRDINPSEASCMKNDPAAEKIPPNRYPSGEDRFELKGPLTSGGIDPCAKKSCEDAATRSPKPDSKSKGNSKAAASSSSSSSTGGKKSDESTLSVKKSQECAGLLSPTIVVGAGSFFKRNDNSAEQMDSPDVDVIGRTVNEKHRVVHDHVDEVFEMLVPACSEEVAACSDDKVEKKDGDSRDERGHKNRYMFEDADGGDYPEFSDKISKA